MAIDRSTELKLWVEISLSVALSLLILLKGPDVDVLLRSRFCDRFSPHRFEPPWLYGMFNKAIPWSGTPFRSSLTPSQVSSTNSWRFLHVAENVSLVAYYKKFVWRIYLKLFHQLNLPQSTTACSSSASWTCAGFSRVPSETWRIWRHRHQLLIREFKEEMFYDLFAGRNHQKRFFSRKQNLSLSEIFAFCIQTWEIVVYDVVWIVTFDGEMREGLALGYC